MLAVNLFHMRAGKIVDRREFFWEDLPELLEATAADTAEPTAGAPGLALRPGIRPAKLRRPHPFRGLLRNAWDSMKTAPKTSSERRHDFSRAETSQRQWGFRPRENKNPLPRRQCLLRPAQAALHRPALRPPHRSSSPSTSTTAKPSPPSSPSAPATASKSPSPQRGEKRSLVDLASQNAKQSYTQRFRVLEPSRKAIQEALADALMLPELPRRIECFDISHIQGAETVASMVVWEDGKMNKSAYRKFKVMTVLGVDDFASMREVVDRRYKRIRDSMNPRQNDCRAGAPGLDSETGDSINPETTGAPSIPGSCGRVRASEERSML